MIAGLVLLALGALVLVSSRTGGPTIPEQVRRGVELLQEGRAAEAIAELRTGASLQPDSDAVFLSLGTALLQAGDSPAAVRELQRAVVLNPQNAKAYYNLGVAFFNSGDYSNAKKAFREAMRVDPALQEAVEGQRLAARWEKRVRGGAPAPVEEGEGADEG